MGPSSESMLKLCRIYKTVGPQNLARLRAYQVQFSVTTSCLADHACMQAFQTCCAAHARSLSGRPPTTQARHSPHSHAQQTQHSSDRQRSLSANNRVPANITKSANRCHVAST
jgi:hypothetical protein